VSDRARVKADQSDFKVQRGAKSKRKEKAIHEKDKRKKNDSQENEEIARKNLSDSRADVSLPDPSSNKRRTAEIEYIGNSCYEEFYLFLFFSFLLLFR